MTTHNRAFKAAPADNITWWGGWDDTTGDFATVLCRTAEEALEEIDRLGATASLREAHGHELGPIPGALFYADASNCAFCRYARPLPPADATACLDAQEHVWLAIADPDGAHPPTWIPVQDWRNTSADDPDRTLFKDGLFWDHLAVQYGPLTFGPQLDPRRATPTVTWRAAEADVPGCSCGMADLGAPGHDHAGPASEQAGLHVQDITADVRCDDQGRSFADAVITLDTGERITVTVHVSLAYSDTINIEIDGDFTTDRPSLRINLNDNLVHDSTRNDPAVDSPRRPDLPDPHGVGDLARQS